MTAAIPVRRSKPEEGGDFKAGFGLIRRLSDFNNVSTP
jgi:hypothetical protein